MGRTIRRRRRGGDVDARMSPMKVSDRVAMYNTMPKMAANASMRPTVSQKQRVLERVAGVSPSTGMSVKERMATLNKSSSSPVSKSYSAPAMGNVHALAAHNATLGGRRRKSRKHRKGTKKGMRRKTARKAYMKRRKSRKGGGFFSSMMGAKDRAKSAAVATGRGMSRGVSAVGHGARNMGQRMSDGLIKYSMGATRSE